MLILKLYNQILISEPKKTELKFDLKIFFRVSHAETTYRDFIELTYSVFKTKKKFIKKSKKFFLGQIGLQSFCGSLISI